MKVIIHDIVIPSKDGTPDKVSVAISEIDSLGRTMPFVRINVKLKDAEVAALDALRQRAKRILVKRTNEALAIVAASPNSTISLDTETPGEDDV
jgi:phenylpyruvate tautomerase PptA (4-oxalocrotonate tautomerase family)